MKMELTKKLGDKLSSIQYLGSELKDLTLIKNIIEKEERKTIAGEYDPWDKEWTIREINIDKYPESKYWKHFITIRIEPDDRVVQYSRLEVDITENQTLTDTDEIIAFFRDIHFDDYIKGIDEIKEMMNVL